MQGMQKLFHFDNYNFKIFKLIFNEFNCKQVSELRIAVERLI